MPRRPSTTLAAFLVACVGIAFLSIMDAVIKGLALAIGTYNTLFWRAIISIALGGLAYTLSRPSWPTRAVLRLHVKRGVVVAIMGLLFFYSITILPLAEAIALSFVAPLIALYLAAILLKERIGRAAIIASLLGLMGVIVILAGRLNSGTHDPRAMIGVAAVLGSALLYAYNIVLTRTQAQLARPGEIAFFQSITIFIVLALAAPWYARAPSVSHVPMLFLGSALSVGGLLLLAWAYARAEAQILIPVEYTAFVWAALCGWLVFDERLTWPVIGGTILIVSGCIIAARGHPQPAQVEEIYA